MKKIMGLLYILYPMSLYITIQQFFIKNQKIDNSTEILITWYSFIFLIIVIIYWCPIIFIKKYEKIKKIYEINVIGIFINFLLITELNNNFLDKMIIYYTIVFITAIVLLSSIVLLYQSFKMQYMIKEEYQKMIDIVDESKDLKTTNKFSKIGILITIAIVIFMNNNILLIISLIIIHFIYKKEIIAISNYILNSKNIKYAICFWIFYVTCISILILSGQNISMFTKITLGSLSLLPINLIAHQKYLKSEYYK